MKTRILVLFSTLTACATAIPYTYQEQCALKGMKLVGVDSGETHTFAMAGGKPVGASSNSQFVRCEVPATDADKQESARIATSAAPKVTYNDSVGTKAFINGLGYFLYVIPGIGMKLYFDAEKNQAIKQSEELARAPASLRP